MSEPQATVGRRRLFTPDRPGTITELTGWRVKCDLCVFEMVYQTNYQEASTLLTKHLDTQHQGWDDVRTPLRV
jgi:hypothetical protein